VISQAQPLIAEQNAPTRHRCPQQYVMTNMAAIGSARRHRRPHQYSETHRSAGKTGTTNDAMDGWFAGYQHNLTTVVWMGYDQPKSLGTKNSVRSWHCRSGSNIWQTALKGEPNYTMPMPDGVQVIGADPYYDNFTPGNGLSPRWGWIAVFRMRCRVLRNSLFWQIERCLGAIIGAGAAAAARNRAICLINTVIDHATHKCSSGFSVKSPLSFACRGDPSIRFVTQDERVL